MSVLHSAYFSFVSFESFWINPTITRFIIQPAFSVFLRHLVGPSRNSQIPKNKRKKLKDTRTDLLSLCWLRRQTVRRSTACRPDDCIPCSQLNHTTRRSQEDWTNRPPCDRTRVEYHNTVRWRFCQWQGNLKKTVTSVTSPDGAHVFDLLFLKFVRHSDTSLWGDYFSKQFQWQLTTTSLTATARSVKRFKVQKEPRYLSLREAWATKKHRWLPFKPRPKNIII